MKKSKYISCRNRIKHNTVKTVKTRSREHRIPVKTGQRPQVLIISIFISYLSTVCKPYPMNFEKQDRFFCPDHSECSELLNS